MARKHHSASSVGLGASCEMAWALAKLAHVREPEVLWDTIQAWTWDRDARAYLSPDGHTRVGSGQRSRALGVAVHAILQGWYEGTTPNWETTAGRIALAGSHHLPGARTGVEVAVCESALGLEPYVTRYKKDDVWHEEHTTVLVTDGIRWLGKKDLRAVATAAECMRLALPAGPVTFDYKTAGSLKPQRDRDGNLYCSVKTPAELERDLAACLYAYDDMAETGLDVAPMRWVYFQTKDKPAATHTDFVVTRMAAEDTIARGVQVARRLDMIHTLDDAELNPLACDAYGGCMHHASRGGRCSGGVKTSAVYDDIAPKENTMAIPQTILDKQARGEALTALEQRIVQMNTAPPAAPAPTPAPAPAPAPTPAPSVQTSPIPAVAQASTPGPSAADAPPPPPPANGPAEPAKPARTRAKKDAPAVDGPESSAAGPVTATLTLTGSLGDLAAILGRLA